MHRTGATSANGPGSAGASASAQVQLQMTTTIAMVKMVGSMRALSTPVTPNPHLPVNITKLGVAKTLLTDQNELMRIIQILILENETHIVAKTNDYHKPKNTSAVYFLTL